MNISFKTLLNLAKLSGARISDITDNSFYCPLYQSEKVKAVLEKIGYAPTGKDYFSKGEHKVYVRDLIAQTEYCDYGHVTEFEYEV